MKRSLLLSLIACLLLHARVVCAAPVVYHPGIYCLGATDVPIDPSNYDSAYVAGGAVRVSWAGLEPTEGAYNWSYLDHEMATAAAKGKHISIFIGGSFKAPLWLLNDPSIHFYYYRNGSQVVKTPLPYDSVYLSKLCRFITAFGHHYRDSTTIAYVRGATESVTQGWGLPGTDTANHTLAGYYHYTTDTMLHTMQRVLDTFMAAFPNTPEWVEVGKLPFDTIGGHHNIYLGEQIAAYGFARYPDRFNVWREDFNACFPVPPDTLSLPNPYTNSYWHILYEHPCHNGAQAVWNLQDVGCTSVPRMDQCDPAQCSKDTVLWRAVQRTLAYGMTYLEIYAADIQTLSLHNTLQQTAGSLKARSAICFGPPTGINTTAASSRAPSWNIYPNPAASVVHLDISAGSTAIAELRDMTGRLQKTVQVNGSIMIDVSALPRGLYIVCLKRAGTPAEERKLLLW